MSSKVRRHPLAATTGLVALCAAVVAIVVTASSGNASSGVTTVSLPASGFASVVERATPSVVQIRSQTGLGSGVVFDSNGHVVTNAHVVAGARRFQVTLADGSTHPATLRGAFPEGDLAVVEVSGATLEPARFADSSEVRAGDYALAIGNPLGLRSSVTDGIVSARSRTVSEGGGVALPSVIQTSAAINPGNSGGALVDSTGAVIGVPTLAALDPELGDSTAPGIGFAISSNAVRSIAPQLIEHGRVTQTGRAWLGVDLRTSMGGGTVVVGVVSGGPAAKAGIRAGDALVEVAGRSATSVDALAIALASQTPGAVVPVEVDGPGGTRTLRVRLGQLPSAG